MCQNHNTQNANQIKGSILLTTNKIPVFMPGLHIKENDNSIITSWISFFGFQRFCRYVDQFGGFANGNQVNCDFATLKALYLEFEEMEQNQSITAILFRNSIFPKCPEVNALNPAEVNGKFNFWLEKARLWLRSKLRRVFYDPQKKARWYHPTSQDK
jgi:hypothetical protein